MKYSLIIGPLTAFSFAVTAHFAGWEWAPNVVASLTILCGIWWVFEPIPMAVVGLLPIALLPLLGVLTPAQVGAAYGNPMILLLLGGFILSTALEKSRVHRRLALKMLQLFGTHSPKRIVFGFMVTSALMSMWISNTATTLILIPVALAVLEESKNKNLQVALLLGIAYSASLGGIGTPIGTPPNLILMQIYTENTGHEISFSKWMSWGVPIVLLFLPLMGLWLTRNVSGKESFKVPNMGPWRVEEQRVVLTFGITALLWMTRKEPFGGWGQWLPQANDACVALLAVVFMFLISNGRGGKLLDWKTAEKIPWGILILFSGGIAIAKGFMVSGLSQELGGAIAHLISWPLIAVTLLICIVVTFLTEVTSNTATTTLLMPILVVGAMTAGIEPILIMAPAAISASCAFMLPVATAPNAIVFGYNKLNVKVMVTNGLILNLIGALLVTLVFTFVSGFYQ